MSYSPKKFRASANELRIPTVLEKYVNVDDGQGGFTQTWVAQTGTIWCGQQPWRAAFTTEGGGMLVQLKYRVLVRYISGLQMGDRWRLNGPFGIWYVESVNDPLNDRHWMVLTCSEVPS